MNSKNPKHVTNIVVVGGRSAGKTALCNILTNYQYESRTSTSTLYQTFESDGRTYGILEVPHVEGDGEKEAHAALVRALDHIEKVSLVVLCVPISQNFTPHLKALVCYYMRMFEDLLERLQLVVLSTGVSSDHIKNWAYRGRNVDDISHSYASAALKAFRENVDSDPLLETPLHGLLGDIPSEDMDIAKLDYTSYCEAKGPANRYVLTLKTRDMIFKAASASAPVWMANRSHPLPPNMEEYRKEKYNSLCHGMLVEEDVLKRFKEENDELYQKIISCQRKESRIRVDIGRVEEEIGSLRNKICCKPVTFESRGIIHFKNRDFVLENVPTENYNLVPILHNCEYEEKYEDGKIFLTIKPNAITLGRNRDAHCGGLVRGRSYALVYAEWEGKDDPQVEKKRSALQLTLENLKADMALAVATKEDSIRERNGNTALTNESEIILRRVLESLGIVSKSRFSLDELDSLSSVKFSEE